MGLDGVEGVVVRFTRERVGVKLPSGTCAIRPERLTVVRAAPVKSGFASSSESESEDKQEERDRDDDAESRSRDQVAEIRPNPEEVSQPSELLAKKGQQLTLSFMESVLKDEVPSSDEMGFWGFVRSGENATGI